MTEFGDALDRWLQPPDVSEHHPDCPQHEDQQVNAGADLNCECDALDAQDVQDAYEMRQDR